MRSLCWSSLPTEPIRRIASCDGAHFHREDDHRLLELERHVFADVHRERGLAHRRPARDDHEVAGLEPGGHAVQIGVAGGHAGHVGRVVAVVELLDAVDDLQQHVLQHRERALPAHALLGDVQDLGLGLVEHRLRAAAEGVVGGVRDLARGGRKAAQDRALAHDVRVMADVGRGRHVGDQRAQVG